LTDRPFISAALKKTGRRGDFAEDLGGTAVKPPETGPEQPLAAAQSCKPFPCEGSTQQDYSEVGK